MVHRALLGSMERFFGCLVEHYAGAFPFWLSPVQAKVLPITDGEHAYAEEVCKELKAEGFRVEIDRRNEKLGFKIREAQIQKIPYMLVVGHEEIKKHALNVRKRTGEQLENKSISELVQMFKTEEKEHR
jgi:threonyl-tRNA synthetase